ncbi:Diacylglycerol kinase catalytic domain-containing protein [Arboricoccus pini]|uniref:Diacylglycerol kinase catalytic domain-containing protein n=1 Tax=Arboricoccus pini TaxID=1963835 RepID=A0A212QMR4_9PROT|nr:diacylglycerol kinase family protein [Arboricoccus pini]SNB60659.1 Diacylglycerol kinase catalytic domain-containing protein [Arboricoccus pini]
MTPVILVHNARSTRNSKGLEALKEVAAADTSVTQLFFDERTDLDEIAAVVQAAVPSLLIVNGGDGTVQGVLTRLLGRFRPATLPHLAVLPRGMANMTAGDCGLRSRNPAALRELLERVAHGRIEETTTHRRVLKVEGVVGREEAVYGMFAGFAGIMDAIRLTTGKVHKTGLKGEWSHLVTLISLLFGLAIGRKPHGALDGEPMRVTIEGKTRQRRELLWLATTLDHLVLRSRPFWNDADSDLRFTSIAYPPPRLIRHAAGILYGWPARPSEAQGFFSQGTDRLSLNYTGTFTIDGEFFEAAMHQPLTLSAPDELAFVRF